MSNASSTRIGGNALLVGGVLWVFGLLFHPDASTMELVASVNRVRWSVVHWAYLAGDVLLVAGVLLLFRHLASARSGSSEGWAAIAFAAGAIAFTLDAVSTSIHLMAFPLAPGSPVTAQSIFDAAGAVNASVGGGGLGLACVSLVTLGVALARSGWSPMVAYGAVIVGGIQFLLFVPTTFGVEALLPVGVVTNLVNATMPAWLAVIGVAFGRVAPVASA
ncbi:MAG: hypothetical protein ACRD3C_00850 [Vicinamibacterales bacterium]